MGSSIAWFSTYVHRTARSARVSRLYVSYDYGQSHVFNKVAGLRPTTLFKKKTLAHVFSCKFCEIFKNTFFLRTPLVAASVQVYGIWMNSEAFLIDFYYRFQLLCRTAPFQSNPFKLSITLACYFWTAAFQNSYFS